MEKAKDDAALRSLAWDFEWAALFTSKDVWLKWRRSKLGRRFRREWLLEGPVHMNLDGTRKKRLPIPKYDEGVGCIGD